MKTLFNTLLSTFALLMTLTLSSCNKQDRYSFKEVNELTVSGIAEELSVELGGQLKLQPKIESSIAESGPFSYQWEIYRDRDLSSLEISATSPITTSTVLSTERDLDFLANISPGKYYLQYTVTDEKFNVSTTVRYPITINPTYYEGWMVLSKKDNGYDLSLLRKDEKIYPNLLKSANPNFVPRGNGVAVYIGIHTKLEEITYFTTDSAYFFNANNFKHIGSSFDRFDTPDILGPIHKPLYTVHIANYDRFIVNAGKVYGSISPNFMGGSSYSVAMSGPADYSLFPLLITGSKYPTMFYDNHNKYFVYLSSVLPSRALNSFSKNPNPTASYDVSNVGKTLIAGGKGPSNEYFLLMKNPSDQYFIHSVNPDLASPAGLASAVSSTAMLNNAAHFAFSEVNRQMYYTVDNKIYIYDILGNNSKLVYEFPASIQIRDMQIFKSQGWGIADPLHNKRLVVATYNGTEGEVYYFDIEPIGDLKNNTYSKKFGGFGEILNINYRHPNF